MTEKGQAAGYLIVGLFAALLNIICRVILNKYVLYEFAIIGAFLIAVTFAFACNQAFVFRTHSPVVIQNYRRFVFVNCLALIQVWVVSVLLESVLSHIILSEWMRKFLAHSIGVAFPVITNFFLYKNFVFLEGEDN